MDNIFNQLADLYSYVFSKWVWEHGEQLEDFCQTISVTSEQKKMLEEQGHVCLYLKKDGTQLCVYSLGCQPFFIKVIENNLTSTNI